MNRIGRRTAYAMLVILVSQLSGRIALAARKRKVYEAPRLRVSNSKLTRIAVQAANAAKDIKRTVVSMGNLQLDDSQLFKV
jgi:hypothetical protein